MPGRFSLVIRHWPSGKLHKVISGFPDRDAAEGTARVMRLDLGDDYAIHVDEQAKVVK